MVVRATLRKDNAEAFELIRSGVANGGMIQRCGIEPSLLPERKSRLKSPLTQIRTGSELLAALGLNKENYK